MVERTGEKESGKKFNISSYEKRRENMMIYETWKECEALVRIIIVQS